MKINFSKSVIAIKYIIQVFSLNFTTYNVTLTHKNENCSTKSL